MGNQRNKGSVIGTVISSIIWAAIGVGMLFLYVLSNDGDISKLKVFFIGAYIIDFICVFIVVSVLKFIRSHWIISTRNIVGYYVSYYIGYPFLGALVGAIIAFFVMGSIIMWSV